MRKLANCQSHDKLSQQQALLNKTSTNSKDLQINECSQQLTYILSASTKPEAIVFIQLFQKRLSTKNLKP